MFALLLLVTKTELSTSSLAPHIHRASIYRRALWVRKARNGTTERRKKKKKTSEEGTVGASAGDLDDLLGSEVDVVFEKDSTV